MPSETAIGIKEPRIVPPQKRSVEGPDFICIGMPKAGTSWLFDQLQYHPDFWMPPVKELQYLNHAVPRLKNVRRHIQRAEKRADARKLRELERKPQRFKAKTRPGDDRDERFLREAKALVGQAMDIDRYAALFRYKGDSLSGDISPPYAGFNDDTVAQLARRLPKVKVVLLVRDPIERMCSGLSMNHRKGNFEKTLLDDASRFREFFEKERMGDRVFPTKIVERWARCARNIQFRHYLFDDIVTEPEQVRQEILLFLGADPNKTSGKLPPHYNRKANSAKLIITNQIQAILVEYFADEVRACAKLFGGRARDWIGRYGL